MEGGRSPQNEQGRKARPALRPYEITELAARFSLNSPDAEALQLFARTMLRDAMRHINASEVEDQRLRAIADAFRRQRFEMAAPSRGGRRHG